MKLIFSILNPRFYRIAYPLLVVLSLTACGISTQQQGVFNKWRDSATPSFEKGITTQAEILTILGPPSQIIGINDQVVFYYMLERIKSQTAIFIVFNWTKKNINYDRAIFFFDQNGVLTEYAFSLEQIPYEKTEE